MKSGVYQKVTCNEGKEEILVELKNTRWENLYTDQYVDEEVETKGWLVKDGKHFCPYCRKKIDEASIPG